ncbi:AI-2E family transporter [Alteriqipengyuania lutimaris]|uniref:AI-2E family transporter n=1 Tax=Alteriqipengyuania lutimaris TaxID=1538146 RepID=UPI00183D68B5|nr:AI-2E family transporter [Alteriqipengyuania lutimaris]MBB3034834.1 putative PurR-regulated permease PerM [Alteriqipengyuania lutimaris]
MSDTAPEPGEPRPGGRRPDEPQSGEPSPPRATPGAPSRTKTGSSKKRTLLAEQELRLLSTLVVLLGIGLFLALPFVLSIGSVVFLPLTTAIILSVLLAPLADRMSSWGLPNTLASTLSLLIFLAVVVLAFGAILQPAFTLFDRLPDLIDQIGGRYQEMQAEFAWLANANDRLAELVGQSGANEVVLASPSVFQQVAISAPVLLLEVMLTFLMAFFMIEARGRVRRNILFGRTSFGTSVKAARVLREVQDRVAAYILTVAWINLGVGMVVALGAWALGLPAPIMWGGLATLLNFIPYVGPLALTALLTLFGLGTADTVFLGLIPPIAYVTLHAFEANAITPAILGRRFTMNPVMILLAFSYFTWIWGAIGALLSVPLLLMLTAFFDHVGRPNLLGFIFGEPLFQTPLLEEGDEADGVKLPEENPA